MTTTSSLNQAASLMDSKLIPCPTCGGQLRAEYKTEWRSVTEACELYGVTVQQLEAAPLQFNAFGQVLAAVPYVTCMHCGLHADGSRRPVIAE